MERELRSSALRAMPTNFARNEKPAVGQAPQDAQP